MKCWRSESNTGSSHQFTKLHCFFFLCNDSLTSLVSHLTSPQRLPNPCGNGITRFSLKQQHTDAFATFHMLFSFSLECLIFLVCLIISSFRLYERLMYSMKPPWWIPLPSVNHILSSLIPAPSTSLLIAWVKLSHITCWSGFLIG